MRVTAGGTVLVLAALFGVGGARAAGLCPSTLGAAARLEDVPPEVRLEWIDARLGEGRRTSRHGAGRCRHSRHVRLWISHTEPVRG